MKKLLLLFIFSFSLLVCQGQTWKWGINTTFCSGDDYPPNPVATDTKGNVYVSGTCEYSNMFLGKYTSSGVQKWGLVETSIIGVYGEAFVNAIATDKLGHVYLTGNFKDTMVFATDTLISKQTNLFLAKYDSNGNMLWIREATLVNGSSTAQSLSVATDPSGNIYITGSFADTVAFGTTKLANSSIYLTKYDSGGNVLWAKQSLGGGTSNAVTTDRFGNAFITGGFTGTTYFDTCKLDTDGVFLVKYSSAGNALWARQSTIGTGSGSSVAADFMGNTYVIGSYGGYTLFGKCGITDGGQVFLTKYSPNGTAIWAERAYPFTGDSGSWAAYSVVADTLAKEGGYLEIGYITSYSPPFWIAFGGDTFYFNPPFAYYGNDWTSSLFVQFDSAGHTLCGQLFSEGDYPMSTLSVDPAGDYVYMGGLCGTRLGFSSGDTVGNGPFLARWQPCGKSLEGIPEADTKGPSVNVFPNPGSGKFNFTIANYEMPDRSTLVIYNTLGQQIYSAVIRNSQFVIDLKGNPAGIYLYRIIDQNNSPLASGKLIVE